MCLITDDKTIYTAEEDITVYKIFVRRHNNEDEALTPYRLFAYKYETLYTTDMTTVTAEEADYNAAFDGQDSDYFLVKYGRRYHEVQEIMVVVQGFHSVLKPERLRDIMAFNQNRRIMLECTIPRGAQYYKGVTDLIVSNQIIVHKKPVSL